MEDDIPRVWRFTFLYQPLTDEEMPSYTYNTNVVIQLHADVGFMKDYTITTKFSKKAVSPREICPSFCVASPKFKLFGGACFYDAPKPKDKEYLEGWGEAKLLVCILNKEKLDNTFISIELS